MNIVEKLSLIVDNETRPAIVWVDTYGAYNTLILYDETQDYSGVTRTTYDSQTFDAVNIYYNVDVRTFERALFGYTGCSTEHLNAAATEYRDKVIHEKEEERRYQQMLEERKREEQIQLREEMYQREQASKPYLKGWKKGSWKIRTSASETLEDMQDVEGLIFGNLGIRKELLNEMWCITHIPSGYRIGPYFSNKTRCKEIAAQVLHTFSGTVPHSEQELLLHKKDLEKILASA